MSTATARRTYLDVLRGAAVLIMIEAHVIDSWTRVGDRANPWFGRSLIVGGFGAPLFLFLAGVAVALSAGSKARRGGDDDAAAKLVQKRGLEIFGLAFLFRLQALVISQSPPYSLLKVDILNIMGPAIVATAWLWGRARSQWSRIAAFAAATAVVSFATPIVRNWSWLARLPDFLEGYIRPVPQLTNFSIFPWAAFVPAGALVGVFLDAARDPSRERRVNIGLGAIGGALAIASYAASFLPSPYARSWFWTSSPSFFFLRLGLMISAIGVAYLWAQRPTAQQRWSPLQLLGRSSLFIYWIHVEMVYGVISIPLHGGLTLVQAWIALLLFWGFMVLLAIGKNRGVRWWKTRGYGAGGPSPLLTASD